MAGFVIWGRDAIIVLFAELDLNPLTLTTPHPPLLHPCSSCQEQFGYFADTVGRCIEGQLRQQKGVIGLTMNK